MATYLYRLGRLAFRRRKLVLAIWLALVGLFGLGAATLSGPTSDDFAIPGTEAQQAQDLLAERFGDNSAGGAEARVVFAAPDGTRLTDPAGRAAVDRTVAAIRSGPHVA